MIRMEATVLEHREAGQTRWWGVCFIGLLSFAAILCVNVPLIDPDEGLHAAIAQEMVERGDWVTPRILGKPFWDKPVLYFWALCTSLSIFGSNEIAIRLPGLFFSLLTIAACWYAARKWFGKRTAQIAVCIQATTLLPYASALVAVHDVALVTWTILALIAFWSIPRYSTRREDLWKPLLAASLALGLAILTKGFVGVAFVFLAYLPAALLTRRLPFLRMIFLLAVAGLGGLLVASPWFALMEWRNPGYLYYYFYERHILGFIAPTRWHGAREWWYYLPILFAGGIPWALYLPGAAAQFMADRRHPSGTGGNAERLLLWCWLLLGLFFLSIAKTKLLSYSLPLFPPLTLLVADFWNRGLNGELRKGAVKFQHFTAAALSFTAPFLMPAIWGVALALGYTQYSTPALLCVLSITAIVALGIASVRRGDWERVFARGVVSMSALAVGTVVCLLPSGAEEFSGRKLATYLNQHLQPEGEVILFRERIGSVLFYLDPQVRKHLASEQIQTSTIREFITTFQPREGQLVVIPEREVPLILHYLEFSHLPYERHERYRIIEGNRFVPLHVRRIPPGPEPTGLLAN